MIKRRDSHDFLVKAVGIDVWSFMFIDTNAAIIIFLVEKVFKKKITYNIFKLIILFTVLAIWCQIYLIISLVRLDFTFYQSKLIATTVTTLILILWGRKLFPYWEKK